MTRALAISATVLVVAGCGGDGGSGDGKPRDPVRVVATASADPSGDLVKFHTEKDLRPPQITVNMGPAEGTRPGLVFMTPRAANPDYPSGPLIHDMKGSVRWFLPRPGRVSSNLEAHTFKGKPVVCWGERPPVKAPPEIFKLDPKDVFFVCFDQSYRELFKLRMVGDDVGTDLHELKITKRNTALLLGWRTVKRDLSSVGDTPSSTIIDAVVQEIDLDTGKLLLNWSALDHIPLSDSMFQLPISREAWDPYHPNSISIASDGNLLVSMRHTSAIYKLDRKTGKILWTFGGKSSDFKVERPDTFYFQHDAQPLGGGKVLLFDNGATFTDRRADFSRIMTFQLDGKTRRARLLSSIVHEPAILAVSQGNARPTENGNIFVGWGNRENFSEYTPEGQQVYDAQVPGNAYQSYRVLKGEWVGKPSGRPKVVADTLRGRTLIWVSWNGATEVARWQVLGGNAARTLRRLGSGRYEGFETRLDVAATPRVLRVQAVDREGKVLASSALIRPE